MRFLHIADLHFGKSIHGVSLLDRGDQPAWTERFLALADQLRPDAVLIAGDIYDRSAPSGDAVTLLDRLLTGLVALELPVLLVAGNHDSGQRLAFASGLLARQKLHIAGVLPEGGRLERVQLSDAYGPVDFWLLPYVFPAAVAHALGDDSIRDYDTAMRRLLEAQELDPSRRNVLIAHQNVTCGGQEGTRGGSETMIGGVGQIDCGVFDAFDYVALGHIHAAGFIGRESIRYAGSPLCYHFNETRQPTKGPVLVTLEGKGSAPRFETCPIPALHPMRELRGAYEKLQKEALEDPRKGEYLRIVLTDRRVTPEISAFFRGAYEARDSIVMELVSEFEQFGAAPDAPAAVEGRSVEELFADFYTERSAGTPPEEPDQQLLCYAGELLRQAPAQQIPEPGEIDKLLMYLLEQEGRA